MSSLIRCHGCGLEEHEHLIDAKDDGTGDYTVMNCIACYGPGYDMLQWSHKHLSVRPELAIHYESYIEHQRLAGVVWC